MKPDTLKFYAELCQIREAFSYVGEPEPKALTQLLKALRTVVHCSLPKWEPEGRIKHPTGGP